MKLTTKSEYTVLALIYLARNEENGYIKIDDICSKYEISKKYLEQLFIILKHSRLIKTKTGASGGYKLSVPSSSITIAQIIRLMDGALAPTESVSEYFFCHTPLEKEGKLLEILREIRDYVSNKLENLTLQDLI